MSSIPNFLGGIPRFPTGKVDQVVYNTLRINICSEFVQNWNVLVIENSSRTYNSLDLWGSGWKFLKSSCFRQNSVLSSTLMLKFVLENLIYCTDQLKRLWPKSTTSKNRFCISTSPQRCENAWCRVSITYATTVLKVV